jgi:hypothetical protein
MLRSASCMYASMRAELAAASSFAAGLPYETQLQQVSQPHHLATSKHTDLGKLSGYHAY